MKPKTILLLVFLIFACVAGCALGNFGQGITVPVNGQPTVFKAYIPPISVAGELLAQPAVNILGLQVGLYNTLVTTLAVDAVIIVLALLVRRGLGERGGRPMSRLTNAVEAYVELLYQNYIVPTLGARSHVVLPIAVTAFTFIMVAGFFELIPGHESIGLAEPVKSGGICAVNVAGVTLTTGEQVTSSATADCGAEVGAERAADLPEGGVTLIPFLRRPTSDLSTTLALALVAFIFIEIQGVRANGAHYFGKFFRFDVLRKTGSGMTGLTNYIQFGVGFLELLSELIRVVTLSFRLFGNMFGGSILVFVMAFILPFILPTVFLGLEFAIAVIQAFVFMMLVVVFTSLAVAHVEH